MRTLIIICLSVFGLVLRLYGQNDFKQVYDRSLENQINSSVGVNGEWQFSPNWYYNFLHSRYKSGDYENNNIIPLDDMIEAATKSLMKVRSAHNSINVVYENEKKHWADRNSDRELSEVLNDIENAKYALQVLTSAFSQTKVPLDDAETIYKEYNRINDKYFLIGDTVRTHMDNQKRRRAYALCLDEFNNLINVCYNLNWNALVASKYREFEELNNNR